MMRALVPILLLTTACGQARHAAPQPHGLAVSVVHADGSPAAGAFVLATMEGVDEEYLLRADAAGTVELDFTQPAAIAVSSGDGYAFIDRWEPREGERFVLDDECVSARGDVIDSGGQPVLPEVVLRLRRYSDQTGDSFFVAARGGKVSLCLPPARYSLAAEGGDYVAPTVSVVIAPDRIELPSYQVWERAGVITPPLSDATSSLLKHSVPATKVEDVLPILASARVIGCGEANHGAAELYRMRKELLAALVSHLGTRAVLIEAGIGEALALDRYLQTGDGDLPTLVADLAYWLWDTDEFTEVLQWIRDHNASVGESARIHVAGVDVQTYAGAWAVIRDHVDDDLRRRLAVFEEEGAVQKYAAMETAQRAIVRSDLDKVETGDRGEVWWAVRALRQLLQLIDTADAVESGAMRDRLMADNVLEAADQLGGGPAMFWAHNVHVAREPYDGITSVGMHLAAALGAEYVPIGYLTGQGALRAWDRRGEIGVIAQPVETPPDYAVEAFLARLEWPAYYVDLHGEGAYRRWFEGPRYLREVTAAWPGEDSAFILRDMVKSFDVIGFARRSDATHPTPTGERRVTK